ncbi:MAG TPA: hypothetical protein DCZ92_01690 [Elusimicrobia bacterium]|nr:MAG: hypothetical protein A2016_12225 [Elusimicrobia bacterium GWF2_62_30]HBA59539.1 hypothetical protein [Elusimicrobiota bacterium]
MSIRSKLILTYLALAIIPLLLLSALTSRKYRGSLENLRLVQLRDISVYKADRLASFFSGLKADIRIAQDFYNIKTNLPVLDSLAANPSAPEFQAAKKMLDGQLQPMQAVKGLTDIMLVNPGGKVVYSSNPAHFRKDFLKSLSDPRQKAFGEGKKKVCFSDVFFRKDEAGRPVMLVSAPIAGFNGKFSGVVVFEVDMSPVYSLIQDSTGLGTTGETLIGQKEGGDVLFLNPLRHDPLAALKRQVSLGGGVGFPVQEAAQGRTGTGLVKDYRGIEVIAAWRPVPGTGWGLVAKIDAAEAFAEADQLRRLVVVILIVLFFICGLTALFIARSISGPIKNLSEGTAIIGSGNLDHKVGTDHTDEIGQLSRAFDAMTENLKKTTASRDELNEEIAERKKTEEALRESGQRLNKAQEMAHLGSWELDIVKNRLSWSDEVYRIFGLKPQEFAATYEAFLAAVHPADRAAVDAAYSGSLREGRDFYEIEHRVVRQATGEVRFVLERCAHFRDGSGAIRRSVGMVHDITEQKKAEAEIRRSNESLEQFAYVASHDLQEPLRVMGSYSELLGRRYQGKLGSDADEFIGYIVDGAKRMQNLINDLLTYSRVGCADKNGGEVDCNAALARVLSGMRNAIAESGAAVTHDSLPVLTGCESDFVQLFQNLISNGVKFRGPGAPRVHIKAERQGSDWLFSVKDNGIGLEPQYKDRIFVIFKRLHAKNDYPGTGIGLAVCKKIVEAQGGRIWVESEPGKGAAFYFTLPAKGPINND